MSEPVIKIDPETLTAAEKQIFSNPSLSKLRVFSEGEFYPVGRMFGSEGQIVVNPLHAFAVIAYAEGKWTMLGCRPGDVEPVREGRPWLH